MPSASSNELHSITKHNNIVISGVGANEVLKFDGSNWINQTLAESGIAALSGAAFTGTITGVTALTVDNLNIDGNTIISTDSNGSITFTPNGSGSVVISKVDINSGAIDGSTIGASSASTVVATQVDITGQGDLRLQDTTGGQHVAIQDAGTTTTHTLTLPATQGGSSTVLTNDGSGGLTWAAAGSYTPVLTRITSAGTTNWSKPATANMVYIECIGAGGGGAGGGQGSANRPGGGAGGGGARATRLMRAADVSSSVSVTVGAGGNGGAGSTSGSTSTDGSVGANTTFGGYLTAYGGGYGSGGANHNGGSGGGISSAGTTNGTQGSRGGEPNGGRCTITSDAYALTSMDLVTPQNSVYGGGASGGSLHRQSQPGDSVWGGGGGGFPGHGTATGADGGKSVYGGAGGGGGGGHNFVQAGTGGGSGPAGGGGGTAGSGSGGNGGNGTAGSDSGTYGGGGGGGGTGNGSGNGGNGGDGATGSGGGGGGSGTGQGGSGGDGGDGEVRIWTW